ncbi:MAG: hypothetical protein IJ343_02270 [Clostridia bacterium]|nr:hypothetical protein [Clostridia bacterium]
MKKMLMLLLVLLLPLCAAAEMDEEGDIVVTLPGAEFFFTPVEDCFWVSRESSASQFNRIGLSQRDVLAHMKAYNIYAMIFFGNAEEGTVEVQVIAAETVETDFDELSEYGEEMLCESFRKSYIDYGYDVASVESYWAPEGHRFIRIEASWMGELGVREYLTEYMTCQAGYTVSILLYPYEGELTESQRLAGELLADSLWITPVSE